MANTASPQIDSPRSLRALTLVDEQITPAALVRLLKNAAPLRGLSEIALLRVMPEPEKVRTRAIMNETVERELTRAAERALEPMKKAIEGDGLACSTAVLITSRLDQILGFGKTANCDLIVAFSEPLSGARKAWLGATGCAGEHTAARIAAISTLPVLVIPKSAGSER